MTKPTREPMELSVKKILMNANKRVSEAVQSVSDGSTEKALCCIREAMDALKKAEKVMEAVYVIEEDVV